MVGACLREPQRQRRHTRRSRTGGLLPERSGTARDDVRAFGLLHETEARLDDLWEPVDAQVLLALGIAYAYGRGTKRDIERGIRYFDQAIAYDSEEAARNRARFEKSFFGLGGWRMR